MTCCSPNDGCCVIDSSEFDLGNVLEMVRKELADRGITFETCCESSEDGNAAVKVVCVHPHLRDSVRAMGECCRDNVVMVRVDEDSAASLDAWVETGTVKSRSEAAALFIREGLKVRASELAQLREALKEVERAKDALRQKTREVLGGDGV